MNTEVDTRVTADLHPQIIDTLDGVTAETAVHVSQAVDALTSAYTFVGSVHDYRAAAFADPTLTPEAALLATDDFAHSKLAAVTRSIDGAVNNMTRSIKALEADLRTDVEAKASKQVSGEVRALFKGSSTAERVKMMDDALEAKDHTVLTAVLGAPAMLSGFTPQIQATYLRAYNAMAKPEVSKRLNALTAARDHLDSRGSLVLREMERAIGTVPVVTQDKAGISRISGKITPQEVRAKRNASRDVYRKLA